MQQPVSPAQMEARVVRYGDLKPCFNAFIDSRTPGSDAKENFTIIGPGVSENPNQFVHIAEPHGFNIGGARQPPGCVNSQHSHDTAEVFIAHSGHWRFDLGEDGQDAQVDVAPGDVISLPTRTFRGFTNIGDGPGFLWAVLGGDDPGRVTWAPKVFQMAQDYGLVLLETGALVDTAAGEAVPTDARPMPVTSPQQVAALRRMTSTDARSLVVQTAAWDGSGQTSVIAPDAPLDWPHGFTLSHLRLAALTAPVNRVSPEVLFVHEGEATLAWPDGDLALGTGDTVTVPEGLTFTLASREGAVVFAVRRVS